MSSRCECVVKRTGKVCAKPTTGFNSQGTPVCGTHTGRPRKRRLVDTPPPTMLRRDPHRGIKQEYPPPPPPPQPTIMLRRDPHRGIKQEYPPPPQPPLPSILSRLDAHQRFKQLKPTQPHQFSFSIHKWLVDRKTVVLLKRLHPERPSIFT